MNILKNVMNKIAEGDKKTELKSEKVELASIADLKSSVSKLEKELEANFKKRNDFFKARQEYSNSVKNIENLRTATNKETKAFAKAAKDLGLSPDSVKEYKDALFVVDSAKKDLADAKKLL